MNLLLDTHYILWAACDQSRVTGKARALITDNQNTLWFSVVSIWEVSIKSALNRADFQMNPSTLRSGLLKNGYRELALEGGHVLGLSTLPMLHKDPFDRILVAQAASENMLLLTVDAKLAGYGDAVLVA